MFSKCYCNVSLVSNSSFLFTRDNMVMRIRYVGALDSYHIIFPLMKHKFFHNHGNKLLLVHE